MRLHKLDKEDFVKIKIFIDALNLMLEKDKFSLTASQDNWKYLDDEDPDKIEILALIKQIKRNDDMDDDDELDPRILAFEYLKKKYKNLWLVNLTADILIDNCCDPQKTYLDYCPQLCELHVAPEQ